MRTLQWTFVFISGLASVAVVGCDRDAATSTAIAASTVGDASTGSAGSGTTGSGGSQGGSCYENDFGHEGFKLPANWNATEPASAYRLVLAVAMANNASVVPSDNTCGLTGKVTGSFDGSLVGCFLNEPYPPPKGGCVGAPEGECTVNCYATCSFKVADQQFTGVDPGAPNNAGVGGYLPATYCATAVADPTVQTALAGLLASYYAFVGTTTIKGVAPTLEQVSSACAEDSDIVAAGTKACATTTTLKTDLVIVGNDDLPVNNGSGSSI
jgi:hypothetical protein